MTQASIQKLDLDISKNLAELADTPINLNNVEVPKIPFSVRKPSHLNLHRPITNCFFTPSKEEQAKLNAILHSKLSQLNEFYQEDIYRVSIKVQDLENNPDANQNLVYIEYKPDPVNREHTFIVLDKSIAYPLVYPGINKERAKISHYVLDSLIEEILMQPYKANQETSPGHTAFIKSGKLYSIPNRVKEACDEVSSKPFASQTIHDFTTLTEFLQGFNPEYNYDKNFLRDLLYNLECFHGRENISAIKKYLNIDEDLFQSDQHRFIEKIDQDNLESIYQYYITFRYGLDVNPKETKNTKTFEFLVNLKLFQNLLANCQKESISLRLTPLANFDLEGDFRVDFANTVDNKTGQEIFTIDCHLSPKLIEEIIEHCDEPDYADIFNNKIIDQHPMLAKLANSPANKT